MNFIRLFQFTISLSIAIFLSGCYKLTAPIVQVRKDPLDSVVFRHRTGQVPYTLKFIGQSYAPEWVDNIAEYGEACAEELLDYAIGPRVTTPEEAEIHVEFVFQAEFISHDQGYKGTAQILVLDRYENQVFSDKGIGMWSSGGMYLGDDEESCANSVFNTMSRALKHVLPRLRATLEVPRITPRIPSGALPDPVWNPENIAVAELRTHALSQGEASTLSDKLRATLVQTKYFRVLSSNDMKEILLQHNFQKTEYCDDKQCLVEMGRILAVQKIIGGSVGRVGETFHLSLRMVNVETGEIEFTSERSFTGKVDQLISLIDEAGLELCAQYAEQRMKDSDKHEALRAQ